MRSRTVARAMLHRGAALCAALAVLCALLPPLPAAGEVLYDTEGGEPLAALLAEGDEAWAASAVPADAAALKVSGKSAVLMDQGSGAVLFEQNAREHLPIASVTKVMTLLLVMEAIANGQLSWEENVTCSATAAGMGGSQIWLEPGEIMTVEELVKAAAVVSANDACAALAEHLCGTIEAFVARMNARAAELGMNDTHFVDCSGLDDSGYSCALDVAVMSRALMTHDEIRRFTTIWMDTLRGGKSQLVNTNKLVRHYAGTTGLKTGTTQAAGHCLAATAEKDGTAFVAVMLGCATTADRFAGARAMLDYAFASYVRSRRRRRRCRRSRCACVWGSRSGRPCRSTRRAGCCSKRASRRTSPTPRSCRTPSTRRWRRDRCWGRGRSRWAARCAANTRSAPPRPCPRARSGGPTARSSPR